MGKKKELFFNQSQICSYFRILHYFTTGKNFLEITYGGLMFYSSIIMKVQ